MLPGRAEQSVARLGVARGVGFCTPSGLVSFVEFDHEIFSMVISPLPMIREGELSVTGESMGTQRWITP